MGRQQSEQALAEQNKQAAWAQTLQSQAAASEAMVGQLSEALAGFSDTFEQRTSALLDQHGREHGPRAQRTGRSRARQAGRLGADPAVAGHGQRTDGGPVERSAGRIQHHVRATRQRLAGQRGPGHEPVAGRTCPGRAAKAGRLDAGPANHGGFAAKRMANRGQPEPGAATGRGRVAGAGCRGDSAQRHRASAPDAGRDVAPAGRIRSAGESAQRSRSPMGRATRRAHGPARRPVAQRTGRLAHRKKARAANRPWRAWPTGKTV